MAGSFVVHGVLLRDDYMKLQQYFRTPADAEHYFPWMLFAHALLATVPTYLIYYAVQPMPAMLVVKQCLFDGVLVLVLGATVAGAGARALRRASGDRRSEVKEEVSAARPSPGDMNGAGRPASWSAARGRCDKLILGRFNHQPATATHGGNASKDTR